MDALMKALTVLALVAVVLTPVMVSDDSDAAGDLDGLMLYQVYADTHCKGVAVHNYGTTSVDLSDYTISDGEGTITFSRTITVPAGGTVILYTLSSSASSDDYDFLNQDCTYYSYSDGTNGITAASNFTPSNSGDDIYLVRNGVNVDAAFYGSKSGNGTDWTGDGVSISTDWIMRTGETDTDTADDWVAYTPGRTYLEFDPDLQFDAIVTPFLFPDSGGIPVYQAVESAETSIWINVYQLQNRNMMALLVEKARDGVGVRILLDGSGFSTSSLQNYATYYIWMIENGIEIRVMDCGGDARYNYDHAKYAIIDGDTVVVTSENWTNDNLNGSIDLHPYSGSDDGNRGWGVIVESSEYADYMEYVFETDWSMDYGDVYKFEEEYTNVTGTSAYYTGYDDAGLESYSAKVTPVLSSDNSYEALEYYISNATERVYSQQQSLGYGIDEDGSPVKLFSDAADRGVEAKLIFSSNVDSEDVEEINMKTLVSAAIMSTPYVHNKGVIADDYVWVSSVNWTSSSFYNNRECAIVIQSAEVADYFAEAFLADFERYYTYDGFTLKVTNETSTFSSGEEVVFTVSTSVSDDYTYVWDFGDGSDLVETTIPSKVYRPADGTYTLTVTATNSLNQTSTATFIYSVGSSASGSGSGDSGDDETFSFDLEEDGIYLIVVVIVLLLIAVVKMRSSSKKKSKKGSKKSSTKKKR